ncbi:hypothetical protein Dsin_012218 [Dipteronia sinensis]|uniref:Uncharacterized protein n=1 Tax=Dipteronia sinensis TaxID=43782 RepID=A0AAE0AHK6_9ROSI|nr:hypothetical protein Dsin_012218 [Dipteronia sinensis]
MCIINLKLILKRTYRRSRSRSREMEFQKIKVANPIVEMDVPDGHDQKTELEVFNFTGAGGVALSMFNTDEVWLKE